MPIPLIRGKIPPDLIKGSAKMGEGNAKREKRGVQTPGESLLARLQFAELECGEVRSGGRQDLKKGIYLN
jgi:hypothetical protein